MLMNIENYQIWAQGGVETPLEGPKIRHPLMTPSIFSKKYPKIITNSIFLLNFDQKFSKFSLDFPTIGFFVQTRKILPLGLAIYYRFT